MIVSMVEDECSCDEYYARLKMCRIQVGQRVTTGYYKGHHPEVGTIMVRDPEPLTPAERADVIASYEEIYRAAGDC